MAATKIHEQERRNVWLSIYSAAVVGLTTSTEPEVYDEDNDELREAATSIADGGLEDYEDTFGDHSHDVDDDEEEDDEEEVDDAEPRAPRKPARKARKKRS